MLYTMIFADAGTDLTSLDYETTQPELDGEPYAADFAANVGLDQSLVIQWTDNASKEIAQACLSELSTIRKRQTRLPSFLDLTPDIAPLIAAAEIVAEAGIAAPVANHHKVATTAVTLDLGPQFHCRGLHDALLQRVMEKAAPARSGFRSS